MPDYKRIAEEELIFFNKLCRRVPGDDKRILKILLLIVYSINL